MAQHGGWTTGASLKIARCSPHAAVSTLPMWLSLQSSVKRAQIRFLKDGSATSSNTASGSDLEPMRATPNAAGHAALHA